MSKYTTEVRYICEMKGGYIQSQGYNAVDEVIDKSWEKIFSIAGLGEKYSWPIFDENYRCVLCKKILKHFYTREICAETVGLWQLWLNQRLDDIMPYYNKLYETELLEYNWLYDTDYYTEGEKQGTEDEITDKDYASNYTRTNDLKETTDKDYTSNYTRTDDLKETTDKDYTSNYTRTDNLNEKTETDISDKTTNSKEWTENGNGNEHSETESTTDSSYTDWDLYSDTPQGGIEGITGDTGDTVNNNFYLTNARKKTDVSTSTTNEENNKEAEYEKEGTEDSSESYTRDLDSIVANTGTQNNSGTETTDSSVTNTGTQNNVGTETTDSTITNTGTQKNDGTETTDTTRDLDTTENYLEHVYGKRNSSKSYMELILELRETFINIDLMIINELNDLFFTLW